MLCWHRQNLALPFIGNRIPLPLILKLCVPVVTRAFTLSRLRLVLPALNPFTPTRWTNQQFRNIAFSPCPYVCVYIYVSEVPITVLVLKMEPENEYTTSSSSLKFEETMTMIDQVVQSQKTSQDTWKCPQIYLCKDRLLMATFYYCHFTATTCEWSNIANE